MKNYFYVLNLSHILIGTNCSNLVFILHFNTPVRHSADNDLSCLFTQMTSYTFLKAIYIGIKNYHGLCTCGKELLRADFIT